MKYSYLISKLEQKLGVVPKQVDLCKILSIKPAAMSARVQRDSEFSDEEISKIEASYSFEINREPEFIYVDYYPNGFVNSSTNYVEYKVPSNLFNYNKTKRYSLYHIKENSMAPLIDCGDFVIFENSTKTEIENGRLYVFSYKDRIYLKRLSVNINQIVVQSSNPDFLTQYIDNDDIEKIQIFGHVVCHGKLLGALPV